MLNYQRVSAEWGLGRVWLVASNMELWSPPSRGFSSFLAVQRDMAWLRSRCLHQIHECLRICQFRPCNPAIYWLVDLFSKLFCMFCCWSPQGIPDIDQPAWITGAGRDRIGLWQWFPRALFFGVWSLDRVGRCGGNRFAFFVLRYAPQIYGTIGFDIFFDASPYQFYLLYCCCWFHCFGSK